jgi:D-hydroxyproline dehydrogenase subunit beta
MPDGRRPVTGADVVVVGAGIVGAATAWEAARRGLDVLLVDRGEVSSGTTGLGEGNVLCGDKDAGPELDLAVLGMGVFDELEDRLGEVARIRRKGALVVHEQAGSWAAEADRVERLRAAGVEAHTVTAGEVRELEPQLTGPLHGATLVPRDLQCDPRAIARALAREVGRVWTGCEVLGLRRDARGSVRGVETARGPVDAGAVVIAAGPWSASLAAAAGLPLPLEPRKGHLVRLRPQRRDTALIRHKLVEGAYLASVASAGAGLEVSTVVETTWEGDVLVGSSRERVGFAGGTNAAAIDGMLGRAATLVPAVAALPVVESWWGFRPWLPDHLPAIGPSRAVPGLWLATGHEGAGVGLGPVSGRVVAQALAGEAPLVDLAPFDPDRFVTSAAGAR